MHILYRRLFRSCQQGDATGLAVHTNRDVVIIIDHDEIAQLQVSRCTGSFTRNAFHGAAITKEAVGMIVHQVKARFVELCSSVRLGNGKANSIAKALAKRSSCDLDAWSVVCFGMARCDAVDLLERQSSVLK